jgi:hypothetical protein
VNAIKPWHVTLAVVVVLTVSAVVWFAVSLVRAARRR